MPTTRAPAKLQLALRVPPSLRADLDTLAQGDQRPLAAIAEEALRLYCQGRRADLLRYASNERRRVKR